MTFALAVFWCLTALELLGWLLPSSKGLRVVAITLFGPMVASMTWLLVAYPGGLTLFLAVITAYRAINTFRLVYGRMDQGYLRRMAVKTSIWLVGFQGVVTVLGMLSEHLGWAVTQAGMVILWVDVIVALILLASTVRHLRTTMPPILSAEVMNDRNLPPLTVAVPARNETDDLDACLASLIASDYPKLEILVLDDCSQNKRTPEIIRSFAHDGVRFLQGVVPAENWLAKNQAYQQLYEAASGELILFCGVDVRVTPTSLRTLVATLVQKHKSMISVIPRNQVPTWSVMQETTLLQPMRYAWELSLPRRLFRRPPVLSTCWLIKRDVLAAAGGFTSVSHSIVPESYFARASTAQDGYSFMQSSDQIGIASNKGIDEQRSTAVRTQYPRVRRRIELVMLLSIAELAIVILPYIGVLLVVLGALPWQFLIPSLLAVLLLTLSYILIVRLTYRRVLARSLVLLPVAVLLDILLLNDSMIRYEFFSVLWKDRNVCIPVMHVTGALPTFSQ